MANSQRPATAARVALATSSSVTGVAPVVAIVILTRRGHNRNSIDERVLKSRLIYRSSIA